MKRVIDGLRLIPEPYQTIALEAFREECEEWGVTEDQPVISFNRFGEVYSGLNYAQVALLTLDWSAGPGWAFWKHLHCYLLMSAKGAHDYPPPALPTTHTNPTT